jgi:hypothetical protein
MQKIELSEDAPSTNETPKAKKRRIKKGNNWENFKTAALYC